MHINPFLLVWRWRKPTGFTQTSTWQSNQSENSREEEENILFETTPLAFFLFVEASKKKCYKKREYKSVQVWAHTVWPINSNLLLQIMYAQLCTLLYS